MALQPPTAQAQLEVPVFHREDQAAVHRPPLIAGAVESPSAEAELFRPEVGFLPPARRLVVLIPEMEVDEAALVRLIWTLAAPRELSVLFLGLNRDPNGESRARRRLTTLAALTRDDWVQAETRIEYASDWVRAIQSNWRPGDLVVCQAEQQVSAWGLKRPLSQALATTLNAPVCVVSGFCSQESRTAPGLGAWLVSWVIPIGIIVGFFWIQVEIIQLSKNWVQTVLLCLSVLVESGLIGISNQFST